MAAYLYVDVKYATLSYGVRYYTSRWVFCFSARIYARCMFTWTVYIFTYMKFSHKMFILSLPIMHGKFAIVVVKKNI